MNCLECGANLVQIPKKRIKQFCGSTCRSNYWQKLKRKIEINNKPDNKEQILKERNTVNKIKEIALPPLTPDEVVPEIDNKAILSQIAAIKAEKCPEHRSKSSMGRKSWQMEQDKMVAELQKQLK